MLFSNKALAGRVFMLRFRFATPLLLTVALCLAAVDGGRYARLAAGERYGVRFAPCFSAESPLLYPMQVPESLGGHRAFRPNFTEEYDPRPYFARYPVTQYGYRTLISNGRFLYRSDVARLWPPGRLAFYAAQRPWFRFSFERDLPPHRPLVAPLAQKPAVAPPHRAVPVLVRNPFAEQATTAEPEEAGNMPGVGEKTVPVRWESSEAVRPLRIANPHVVGGE